MKNKTPVFMDLLTSFFTDYMPYSAGLSENTIDSYKYAFRLLMEFLYSNNDIAAVDVTFQKLDFESITQFLNWIEIDRKCSVSTRNQRLAALSSFATYAQNRNLDAAVFANVIGKIPVKRQAAKPRTTFTLDEIAALLKLPNENTTIGLRDKVLLNLMYASGARAQEACDLTVRNAQFQGDITKLTITGKGNKTRRIIIAKPCGILLKQYLYKRGISQSLNRHIFSSQTHEHMSVSCIEGIFKKYLKLVKEQNPTLFCEPSYSPHSMRHTTASHMLEAGVPLIAIKNFLGHVSVHTTERYAELTQSTVNNYIKEWNSKWFPQTIDVSFSRPSRNPLPDFLN